MQQSHFAQTAHVVEQGQNLYQSQSDYPYPPTYAWLLAAVVHQASALDISDNFAVRLPPLVADSLCAVVVWLIAQRHWPGRALRLGWLYALNPITISIVSHLSQFDPLAYLPALTALWVYEAAGALWLSAVLLGVGGALKIAPAFIALAWLPEMPNPRRLFVFAALVGLPVAAAMLAGWASAPGAFAANVLGYRAAAEGGWGYNFLALLLEHLGRWLGAGWLLSFTGWIRGLHRELLLASLFVTAYLARRKTLLQRAFLVQLSVQLFAGRWSHQYTAWLVPLLVLINQRGLIPWGILTTLWMGLAYIAFDSSGLLQDNLFRAATLFGFASWLVAGVWWLGNLKSQAIPIFQWFTAPLFPPSE